MRSSIAVVTLALGMPAPGLAHEGPRIWIGFEGGNVATNAGDDDHSPTAYAPARLFATELSSLAGIWTTSFPGFEVRRDGGGVPGETTFGFDIAGPLLYYDAGADEFATVDDYFAVPGPVPQLAISLGASLRTTGPGPVAGFDFFTYFETGDHSHLSFTLLGDGAAPVDGPAGVYALQLTLNCDAAAPSKPLWLLIGKQVAAADPEFLAAFDAAERDLVPPPPCPGDTDGDRDVDLDDLLLGLGNFGCTDSCAAGRVDDDDDVDLDDLLLTLGGFGVVCAP